MQAALAKVDLACGDSKEQKRAACIPWARRNRCRGGNLESLCWFRWLRSVQIHLHMYWTLPNGRVFSGDRPERQCIVSTSHNGARTRCGCVWWTWRVRLHVVQKTFTFITPLRMYGMRLPKWWKKAHNTHDTLSRSVMAGERTPCSLDETDSCLNSSESSTRIAVQETWLF